MVGNLASRNRAAPIFPEYAVAWIEREIEGIGNRPAESYEISPGDKAELLELVKYWKGRTLHDKAEALLSPELKAIHDSGMVRAEGNMTSGDGHIAPNMRRILELGLGGYRAWVARELEADDVSTWEGLRRRQLHLAMIDALEGFSAYIRRFAGAGGRRGCPGLFEGPRRGARDDLEDLRRQSRKGRPGSFREALQLAYFVQLVLQIESNGHSLSFGRMDQFLGPLLRPRSRLAAHLARGGGRAARGDLAQAPGDQEDPLLVPHALLRGRSPLPECHHRRRGPGREGCDQPALLPHPRDGGRAAAHAAQPLRALPQGHDARSSSTPAPA